MKLVEWVNQVLPVMYSKVVVKVEATVTEGEVKMYWAGTIIRIDLKPKE